MTLQDKIVDLSVGRTTESIPHPDEFEKTKLGIL